MPHVTIKHYPRDLSAEQQQALADEVTALIARHFGSQPQSVSLALQEVSPEAWKQAVWDPEIAPQLATLAKKPGYSL
ncbi:tautomerase PptA [Pantoea sp. 1.19]|uniref:tautomerase PptA n=1 Tax=Pantoea sp. 1.19 TaxID=1925589 RepID=UPI000948997E|nr:tautomerase PptA [Pantoea sp. 1.19]